MQCEQGLYALMLMRKHHDVKLRMIGTGDAGLADPKIVVAQPLESTGYMTHELQLALMRHLHGAQLACVKFDGAAAVMTALCKRTFPLPHFESWETPLSPSGIPIVAASAAADGITGLLAEIGKPILFRQIPVDSKIFAVLKIEATHFHVMSQWKRAGLTTAGSFDQWLQDNFDHKRRKEMKRLRARLSEQGLLETRRLSDSSELSKFIDEFLRLESAGWKGNGGTAIAQDEALVRAFREGLTALFAEGKLRFWQITLDGKAVASLFAFVECGRVTLGKIAHDETFAKYSPGVQIIIDATADFFADPRIALADANAIPNHPMIDRIWRDRLPMANVLVASDAVSSTYFQSLVFLESQRLGLRETFKNLYYRVKGVKAS